MKSGVASLFSFLIVVAASAPTLADEQRSQPESSATAASGTKLDLNTATLSALESVPVIGADGARAIIAARPFATIDELDRVQGVSAERLEQIRARVMVATPQRAMTNVGRTASAGTGPATPQTTIEASKAKVDINTADLRMLESIPAIGPETARAIVAARPFSSLDELNRVKGISAERLEQIRAELTVAPETAKPKAKKKKAKSVETP
jgi:competence protein ComEA